MRSVQIVRFAHSPISRASIDEACLAPAGTAAPFACALSRSSHHPPPSCPRPAPRLFLPRLAVCPQFTPQSGPRSPASDTALPPRRPSVAQRRPRYHEGSDSCPRHLAGQVSPAYLAAPSQRSVLNHVVRPGSLYPPTQRSRSFRLRHHEPARHASRRIRFVSYGPPVRLGLLSTPSHDDAVTFGYGASGILRHGLPPC